MTAEHDAVGASGDALSLIGQTLAGKYRVDRMIGEGGTGLVYAGENLVLGAKVAIKCTKPGESMHDAFMKEARLLFSFSHPNVVRLYDAGEVQSVRGKLSYVVLEYLDGISLDQEIERRVASGLKFTLGELRTVTDAILEALRAAHAAGFVHRDMKPSNVMLCHDGLVKVLDFGTARLISQATRFGSQFTPRYAAPEQWEPERAQAGAYTDVFGVGLLIYEMATLKAAFDGKDLPSILKACLAEERPSLLAHRPELTPLLQPVLDRALALEPRERYADAGEMLSAVQSCWTLKKNSPLVATLPLTHKPSVKPSARVPTSPLQIQQSTTLPLAGAPIALPLAAKLAQPPSPTAGSQEVLAVPLQRSSGLLVLALVAFAVVIASVVAALTWD